MFISKWSNVRNAVVIFFLENHIFQPWNNRIDGSLVNSLERILIALDGGEPDRIPRALSFYNVKIDTIAPRGEITMDMVDVHFVDFPISREERQLSRKALPNSGDTRLGSISQVSTYRRWKYKPQDRIHRNPLAQVHSLEDIKNFPFPEISNPKLNRKLARQVKRLHAHGFAVGGNLPHLGGELFEAAWRLRGLENFLLDLIERPDWVHFILDRLTNLARRNAIELAKAGVDILSMDDDVGMPGSMIISPVIWRKYFKQRMKDIIIAARSVKSDLRVLYHSDGFFEPILGDLVEIGVNAINPLQPEYMNAEHIRRRFGPRLAFWGTIGYHTTFSYASPVQIRKEVKQRISTIGRAGLILCPSYDIDEPDIPWQNVVAFLKAAREFG